MPSKSFLVWDIDELLMLGAQKILRICCTPSVGCLIKLFKRLEASQKNVVHTSSMACAIFFAFLFDANRA